MRPGGSAPAVSRPRRPGPGPGTRSLLRPEALGRLLPRPPPPMEPDALPSPLLGLAEDDEADLTDWNLPLAFMKKRHCEKIEGSKSLAQSWRMKDRVGGPAPAPRGRAPTDGRGAFRAPALGSAGEGCVAQQVSGGPHFKLKF